MPLVEFLLAKGVGQITVADVDAIRVEVAIQHTRQLPNGDRVTYELVERGNMDILFKGESTIECELLIINNLTGNRM